MSDEASPDSSAALTGQAGARSTARCRARRCSNPLADAPAKRRIPSSAGHEWRPGSHPQVDVEGPDILDDEFPVFLEFLVVDAYPVADLIREGKKQDDPGGDVAEDGPAGK